MAKLTRRYNARYNQSALADILYAHMKLMGALESLEEWLEDGEEMEVETVIHLEERADALHEAIIKIWRYPLDKSKPVGGD